MRSVGDAVAIVVGESEKAVDKALNMIKVKYTVLEPVLDFRKSLDNKVLVHPEDDWSSSIDTGDVKRNLIHHEEDEHGNVEKILSECDEIIEHTYRIKAAPVSYTHLDVYKRQGYDSCDDAAVYKISDDTAVVQTLDFFPPMVDDPYTFGQIAAANALSDIYAMGGTVKTALNIVCFPEKMDLNILGKIMQGGADKVIEAGGTLAGGHSIADSDVKYGLSVMGTVHPEHIYSNNTGQPSDVLILTKKLGVGLVCNANRVGEAPLLSLIHICISVIDSCNLNCYYCNPQDNNKKCQAINTLSVKKVFCICLLYTSRCV